MIYIAHRGNINGPDPKHENSPAQIKLAISKKLCCEVDVWFVNGHFILGHDEPLYRVKETFLENEKLWCHAKNLAALEKMLTNKSIHCFWHGQDHYALTSKGYIWTFPGHPVKERSIAVKLEPPAPISLKCYGICTDYPLLFQE